MEDVCGLVMALVLFAGLPIAVGTYGLKKGRIPIRGGYALRDERPFLFWLNISACFFTAVVCVAWVVFVVVVDGVQWP